MRPGGVRHRTGGLAEARLLILDGDVQQGLGCSTKRGWQRSPETWIHSRRGRLLRTVCALQGLAQYDVAEEWTEAMERWCETNAIGSLLSVAAGSPPRAEILRLGGSCNEAESQALVAC